MKKEKLLYTKSVIFNKQKNYLYYYVTFEDNVLFEEETTSYGIKVTINNQPPYECMQQFATYERAKEIITTLAKYKVTPIICCDVIADLLKE